MRFAAVRLMVEGRSTIERLRYEVRTPVVCMPVPRGFVEHVDAVGVEGCKATVGTYVKA